MIAALAIVAVLAAATLSAWVVSVVFRDARTRDRAWEKKEAIWADERQQLLDRVMYLADHPWQMPGENEQEQVIDEEPLYDPLQEPIPIGDYMLEVQPMGSV